MYKIIYLPLVEEVVFYDSCVKIKATGDTMWKPIITETYDDAKCIIDNSIFYINIVGGNSNEEILPPFKETFGCPPHKDNVKIIPNHLLEPIEIK